MLDKPKNINNFISVGLWFTEIKIYGPVLS